MIAIGSDHGGYELKQEILSKLKENNIDYIDVGCYSKEAVDYPVFAKLVGDLITSKKCDKGILICGTGVGISIAANKMKGIRAALCSDCYTAEATREHNNSNVLCLGGRVIGIEVAKKIVETFLNTEFSNEQRHVNRINQIED